MADTCVDGVHMRVSPCGVGWGGRPCKTYEGNTWHESGFYSVTAQLHVML